MQASSPARRLAAARSSRRRTRLSVATVAVATGLATAGCGDKSYCDSERHLRVKLKPDDAPLYVLVEEDDKIKPKCEVEAHHQVTHIFGKPSKTVVQVLKVTCPEPYPFEEIYIRSPETLVPVHAGGGHTLTTDQCEIGHIGPGPQRVSAMIAELIEEGGSLAAASASKKITKAGTRPLLDYQTQGETPEASHGSPLVQQPTTHKSRRRRVRGKTRRMPASSAHPGDTMSGASAAQPATADVSAVGIGAEHGGGEQPAASEQDETSYKPI